MGSSFERAPNPTRGAPSSTRSTWSQPSAVSNGLRVSSQRAARPTGTSRRDSLPGVFEHDTHDCDRFDIADTLESLGAAARSMATFAESLTPEEQVVIAVYSKDQVINTTAVIRHALHDAEHHLLDIRRGIARQQLRR